MILVDSSVWIAFFKGRDEGKPLSLLLEQNRVFVNDLILTELIPSLLHKRESRLADLMRALPCLEMRIDWNHLSEMQTKNLSRGLNRIGIPDLIIAQNSLQHDISLFTLDKHFALMRDLHHLTIFPEH